MKIDRKQLVCSYILSSCLWDAASSLFGSAGHADRADEADHVGLYIHIWEQQIVRYLHVNRKLNRVPAKLNFERYSNVCTGVNSSTNLIDISTNEIM